MLRRVTFSRRAPLKWSSFPSIMATLCLHWLCTMGTLPSYLCWVENETMASQVSIAMLANASKSRSVCLTCPLDRCVPNEGKFNCLPPTHWPRIRQFILSAFSFGSLPKIVMHLLVQRSPFLEESCAHIRSLPSVKMHECVLQSLHQLGAHHD